MIKNEEQFKNLFYLFMLEDLFDDTMNFDYLVKCLKDYITKKGYIVLNYNDYGVATKTRCIFDLDELANYFNTYGRI